MKKQYPDIEDCLKEINRLYEIDKLSKIPELKTYINIKTNNVTTLKNNNYLITKEKENLRITYQIDNNLQLQILVCTLLWQSIIHLFKKKLISRKLYKTIYNLTEHLKRKNHILQGTSIRLNIFEYLTTQSILEEISNLFKKIPLPNNITYIILYSLHYTYNEHLIFEKPIKKQLLHKIKILSYFRNIKQKKHIPDRNEDYQKYVHHINGYIIELNKIGNNINQITKIINSTKNLNQKTTTNLKQEILTLNKNLNKQSKEFFQEIIKQKPQ